ncbi:AAA family ATPase, partial [Morganella morganii]|uniref:AAA family ATPase n=1 Tax=Morganella morganii TaxID=582 RepID=UPI000BD11639
SRLPFESGGPRMRLRRLDLIRYGKFTDCSIDFGKDEADIETFIDVVLAEGNDTVVSRLKAGAPE